MGAIYCWLGRRLAVAIVVGTLGSSLPGCSVFKPGPAPADRARMSESELDVAADLWWRQRQPREALKHALESVKLDPDNGDAAHLVSLIYLDFCQNSSLDECRLDEAEKHARQAVNSRKDFPQAQNTLAVILIHQGKLAEAVSILEPLTENILYPTPEIAWGNLGWARLEQGRPADAIGALRRAVAAQPLFCVGNYRLGLAYEQTGDLEASVAAFNRALETNAPGCANLQEAYLHRAKVHLALGKLELTRADLDRCVGLQKSSAVGRRCGELLSTLH